MPDPNQPTDRPDSSLLDLFCGSGPDTDPPCAPYAFAGRHAGRGIVLIGEELWEIPGEPDPPAQGVVDALHRGVDRYLQQP